VQPIKITDKPIWTNEECYQNQCRP